MKLIHDCVRDTLITIEKHLIDDDKLTLSEIKEHISNYSYEDIKYTCKKLDEAEFITYKEYVTGDIAILSITYQGHVFLDSIRDNGIWKSTKNKISKLTSVSLPVIQQVASQLIVSKLGI